eukprot:403348384
MSIITKGIGKLARKCVNQEALETLATKLEDNPWAMTNRLNPNGEKLQDGAIQRQSVVPNRKLLHPSMNLEKVGMYKHPEHNEKASGSCYIYSDPREDNMNYRKKVVRIFQMEKFHTQCHPAIKQRYPGWAIERLNEGFFRHPLHMWSTATCDVSDHFSNARVKVGSLQSAVDYCEMMGWGYEIQYPNSRWFTKKSYSDNFAWKGHPKEEQPYD